SASSLRAVPAADSAGRHPSVPASDHPLAPRVPAVSRALLATRPLGRRGRIGIPGDRDLLLRLALRFGSTLHALAGVGIPQPGLEIADPGLGELDALQRRSAPALHIGNEPVQRLLGILTAPGNGSVVAARLFQHLLHIANKAGTHLAFGYRGEPHLLGRFRAPAGLLLLAKCLLERRRALLLLEPGSGFHLSPCLSLGLRFPPGRVGLLAGSSLLGSASGIGLRARSRLGLLVRLQHRGRKVGLPPPILLDAGARGFALSPAPLPGLPAHVVDSAECPADERYRRRHGPPWS